VTLLGIVFFFILAVDRGWIGPVGRVGLGAAASLLLFSAGLELRRRFGTTDTALAAVGAGMAGLYVTLLAATELYHLVTPVGALLAAAAVAGLGVFTALQWRSELVAGFALTGALLAPPALALQGGITTIGTAFAAVVFAASAAVSFRMAWRGLLLASMALSVPQITALVLLPANHATADGGVVAVAAVFAAIYLATGIAYHFVLGKGQLDAVTTALVFGAGVLAAGSSYRLFSTPAAQGLALLTVTIVYAVLAAAIHTRGERDLSALFAAAAFIACALALASLLTGQPLTYAWAAEAAAVAWLARRTGEPRFRFWSTVYAGLAVGHLLAVDAPPRDLGVESSVSASGAPAALAVAVALAVYAFLAASWPERPGDGTVAELDEAFAELEPAFTVAAQWLAGALLLYSASLAIVGLSSSFGWAHVAVAGLWGVAGLAIVLLAARRRAEGTLLGGEIWLTVVTFLVFAHGGELDDGPRGWSFVVIATVLLAAAHALELRPSRVAPIDSFAILAVVGAQGGFLAAAATLLHTRHAFGLAVLGLAAVDAVLSAVLFRRPRERDFVTILWGAAAVLVAAAVPLLLDGVEMTVAWAVTAVCLAVLVRVTGEERFLAAAAGFAGLALVRALTIDAPLTHLFGTEMSRGGTLALLVSAGSIAAIALVSRRYRPVVVALAGCVAVYGLSIAILRAAEDLYPGKLDSAFHTGHTLVSALWGLVALGLLYVGLKHYPALRIAGFVVFGIALGKLFLFDLSFLDSVTRALSFLAVGTVLLAGGFFYQRLTVTLRAGSD
jgi:uncharacterized membrane protein